MLVTKHDVIDERHRSPRAGDGIEAESGRFEEAFDAAANIRIRGRRVQDDTVRGGDNFLGGPGLVAGFVLAVRFVLQHQHRGGGRREDEFAMARAGE